MKDPSAKVKHMKVFVVEVGSYSDTHIAGVFSTETRALAKANALHGRVAAFELDAEDDFPAGLQSWAVYLSKETGEFKMICSEDTPPSDTEPVYQYADYEYPKGPAARRLLGYTLRIECWARDREHAIKIATDKRKEILAKEAGA